jgi:hypothetical protein
MAAHQLSGRWSYPTFNWFVHKRSAVKRIERPESSAGYGQLRVQFSDRVSTETLKVLHAAGLAGDVPADLTELIQAVGGASISSVHHLSEEEITDDKYGFARDFKLYLQAGREVDPAIESLKKSPLVKSARPILLLRSMDP